jgi:molybdate transport system substrate-binding protein
VPPIYAKTSGHRVAVSFGNATAIQSKVTAGEPVDIVILPPAQLDPLVRQSFVGVARPFGVVRLGVAGRAGGPQPPVATPDEFKRALRRSLVWHARPGRRFDFVDLSRQADERARHR